MGNWNSELAPLLSLALMAGLTACGDDNVLEPREFGTLQIVNASTTVDTVAMFVDGATLPDIFALRRTNSACIPILAGEHTLRFRQVRGSTDLATAQYDFVAGTRYTIVYGTAGQTNAATILPDAFTAPDTSVSIMARFINASSAPGDVHATTPGGTLGAPTIPNLGVVVAGAADLPFVTIPRASTQIQFFDPGTTTGTPRATVNLTGLPANRVSNVIFMDPGTPAGATGLRFNACT